MVVWNSMLLKIIIILLGVARHHVRFIFPLLSLFSKTYRQIFMSTLLIHLIKMHMVWRNKYTFLPFYRGVII